MRNSSLVEWSCADNVTGLKSRAEAADAVVILRGSGASISALKRRDDPSWSVVECECWHE